MVEEPDWKQYEKEVTAHLRELAGKDATVEWDQKLPGRFSGIDRQVDVLVTGNFGGGIGQAQAVVDCKHYKGNVDVKNVETFIGLVEDVNADLGFLITKHGYSKAARRRATAARGIRVKVVERRVIDVVRTDELTDYQVPYAGAHEEPYYTSDFYDHEPYGPSGTTIAYVRESTQDWEVLDTDVHWADEDGRRACAKVILSHRLGGEPGAEDIDRFVAELTPEWEDGQYWVVWDSELGHVGL